MIMVGEGVWQRDFREYHTARGRRKDGPRMKI